MLFVQGGRDAFGTPAELGPVVASLSSAAMLYAVEGADHSLKLPRKSPAEQTAVYAGVQRTIVDWIRTIIATGGEILPRHD